MNYQVQRDETKEGYRLRASLSAGGSLVCKTTAAKKSLLSLLEAVEHQLHASRHAQLIEDSEQIISHDLWLAGGYSSAEVALFCYEIAIALAAISWKERGMSSVEAVVVTALSFAALAVVEIRLGSLQLGHNLSRPVLSSRAVSNKRTTDV